MSRVVLILLFLSAVARADDLDEARKARAAGDIERARQILEPLESPEAKTLLGEILEPSDPKRAARLYKDAAKNDHVEAKYRLALCYRDGRGVARLLGKAEKLLASIAGSHKQARFARACLLLDERGFQARRDEGIKVIYWLAMDGHADAQFRAACLAMDRDDIPVLPDQVKRWVLAHAGRGNAEAQYRAGQLVMLNEADQIRWLRRAARQGHVGAKVLFAERIDYFKGTTKADWVQAKQWLTDAAVAGEPRAAYRLHSVLMKLDHDWVEWYAWLLVHQRMVKALRIKNKHKAYIRTQRIGSEDEVAKAQKHARALWDQVKAGVAARKAER